MAETWPPNYVSVFKWRQQQLKLYRANPAVFRAAKAYYKTHPEEWIDDWCDTFDPRKAGKGLTRVPMKLFKRQREMVQFLYSCLLDQESGLIEKARDMGATWVCVCFSIWLYIFWDGAAIGWGSRKQELVDRIGDMSSIFEKLRATLLGLPVDFLPAGFTEGTCLHFMKILHPSNGSSITGESGDNIGRGGRNLIFFKDESAHYERPEKIEAALGDNTRVQLDISSVNGKGNPFHNRREAGYDWEPGCLPPKGQVRVFVMDWSDHPEKTQEWYDQRRAKAEAEGLLHLFAQEVDRDYASAVQGIIIKPEWVNAAVDAHIKLGFNDAGPWVGALDVADSFEGGGDKNAYAFRKGVVLREVDQWGAPDTGFTTRKAVEAARGRFPIALQYDSIGVGSGVKAEANRLVEEKLMPSGVNLVAWNAGAKVLNPEQRVIKGDKNSPINEDFYQNLKAQGWWELRKRFYNTYRAVTEGIQFDFNELISLDSTMPLLRKVKDELSQPTYGTSSNMKLLVNKTPEGTKSPNLADAVMMCYWPCKGSVAMKISDNVLLQAGMHRW